MKILIAILAVAAVVAVLSIFGRRTRAAVPPPSACLDPTFPLSGKVMSRDGAGIRSARVQARRQEDGLVWSGLANSFGEYEFNVPNCGTFTIQPLMKGYYFGPVTMQLPSDIFHEGRTLDFYAN